MHLTYARKPGLYSVAYGSRIEGNMDSVFRTKSNKAFAGMCSSAEIPYMFLVVSMTSTYIIYSLIGAAHTDVMKSCANERLGTSR